MTKEPSSWSEATVEVELKALGQATRTANSHTQDVEFQALRIPYIQEDELVHVDRECGLLVVIWGEDSPI